MFYANCFLHLTLNEYRSIKLLPMFYSLCSACFRSFFFPKYVLYVKKFTFWKLSSLNMTFIVPAGNGERDLSSEMLLQRSWNITLRTSQVLSFNNFVADYIQCEWMAMIFFLAKNVLHLIVKFTTPDDYLELLNCFCFSSILFCTYASLQIVKVFYLLSWK
jgi:hypothetical protein